MCLDEITRIAPSTCNDGSVYKFNVECATGSQRISDIWGNLILEAVKADFPILADEGISFGYFLLKVSRIKYIIEGAID